MNWFKENINALRIRFPELAERALLPGVNGQVCALPAQDGMPAYGIQKDDQLQPLTNPVNPMEQLNEELGKWHEKTNDFSRPILIVGLNPGAEVLHLFEQREQATGNECAQPLWICIDSILTFCGFLQTYDARALFASERVELFWHEDIVDQVQWLHDHPEFPYIFSMISLSPPETQMKIFSPFLQLAKQRDQQMVDYQEANNAYYDAIDDKQLAAILSGNSGRRPRLLVPSCPWSTVIQYSIRDTCRAFEKAGWETEILDSPAVIPSHYVMESINRFKPDVFLYVSHLRTEAPGVIPDNLMMISWVQDPLPTINSSEAARQWNANAAGRKRDLLTGYVDQLRPFGYLKDRLVPLNMIVDVETFRSRTLTEEQKGKYACDVCFASNAGLPTDRVVRERLVALLVPYGCDEQLAMDIHDQLRIRYRAGNAITRYDQLRAFLKQISPFKRLYDELTTDQQDELIELLFWRLNDLIYRHAVLEWLDDYAQSHADFRMNLYGTDWELHPRFSKYARGCVAHGEELSIALQCARFSLHLNAAEGPHQRLNEILASGGVPLLRHGDVGTIVTPALASAFRLLFAAGKTTAEVQLPPQELGAWNTFLYQTADSAFHAHPELSQEELQQRVHAEVVLRLAINPDWMLPDWRALTFNKSTDLLSALSQNSISGNQDASAIFPMLTQASHAERLSAEIMKQLGMMPVYYGDELPGLSAIIAHIDLLRQKPLPTDWSARLEQVDDLCPNLVNLYSKAAWRQYVETDLAYDKALPWMSRDWDAGRMEGEWLLHYAHALAACGEASDALIDYAYETDPALANGYARCAWMTCFTLDYQPEQALCGFEKDLKLGRLSGQFRLNYAMLLACTGQREAAEEYVAETYRSDRGGDNGYTQLDWAEHVILHRETERRFERDERLGRSAPWGSIMAAGILARHGERAEAEGCVARAYQDSAASSGGYTTVAAIDFLINKDLNYSLNLLERDAQMGRRLPFHQIVQAAFLQRAGHEAEAAECCRAASERSSLAWQIAVSWLRRSGYDAPMLNTLLTPELRAHFEPADKEQLCVSGG